MIKEIFPSSKVAYSKDEIRFFEISRDESETKQAKEVLEVITKLTNEGFRLEKISYQWPKESATLKFFKIHEDGDNHERDFIPSLE